MTKSIAEIQVMFDACCRYDDKDKKMQLMKYYEEMGEFFREYLIFVCHLEKVKSMSHRRTCFAKIIEEAFDCLIVLSRLFDRKIPPFCEKPQINIDDAFYAVSIAVHDEDSEMIANYLSIICKTESNYNGYLAMKVTKWHDILIKNGLISCEVL